MSDKAFMLLPLKKEISDVMFSVKSDSINPVLERYGVDRQGLHDLLWEELNIPGMEVRTANTAFDFLIVSCEENRELETSLKAEVKKNILGAGVFYTNIAPEAVHPSECMYEMQGR